MTQIDQTPQETFRAELTISGDKTDACFQQAVPDKLSTLCALIERVIVPMTFLQTFHSENAEV